MLNNHRKALEMLWKGICTVQVMQEVFNEVTKRTEFKEVTLYENKPCKLSFESITSANEVDNVASISQGTKLFIGNEYLIPAGSKITVTQNGKTTAYERSGEPAIYTNHQEVPLLLFESYA